MILHSLRKLIKGKKRLPLRPAHSLHLEILEERVVPSSQPDLTVLNASLGSGTLVTGNNDQVSVTWTVKNQGTAAPTQSWQDSFYLSSKSTYDSSAQFVGSKQRSDALPLAIGGSYTATTTLTIPSSTLQGSQFLLVVTDPANTINESSTTNNSFAVPVQVSPPNVHLAVSNPSVVPTNLVAGNGASVSVSWKVTNQGTDPAQTTWDDAVYLSSKTVYDTSAVFLTSFNAPQTLAAGASYTQTQNVPIRNTTLLGSENLLIVANDDAVQGENSTTGGTAVLPVTVASPGNVDLEVVPGSVTAPASATLGQSIPVSWTVKNLGSGPANATWSDVVYSSPTATYNAATAHFLTSVTAPQTLAASGSYTQTESVTLPAASQGDSFLLVRTNAFNAQAETDAANPSNDVAASATIALSTPNLAITSFNAPASANLGDTITLSWAVKNTSTVATVAGWSDALYISDSATYDQTAQLLTTFTAPLAGGLAAGASYTQTEQYTLPYTATGNRTLFLVADYNTFQGYQPISGTTPLVASAPLTLGAPDLSIALNAAPTSAVLGQPFNVSWTVTNKGSVAANAAWTDAVFVSSSATFDPLTATQLTTVPAPTTLAAGGSYTSAATVTLPSMAAGSYYLFAVADRLNNQGKLNESIDNVTGQPLTVTGPDLTVKINSATSAVTAGNGVSATLSWTVTNATADAVATWYDVVYLSSSATLNLNAAGTYWNLGSFSEPINGPLNAGASYSTTQSAVVPAVPAAGTYYLIVATNSYYGGYSSQPQAETNTANDFDSHALSVTLPSVTLQVQSASINPPSPVAGGSATVTWTVKNVGTSTAGASWSDNVYLSSKPTLDTSAVLVTSFTYNGGTTPLAPGATYTSMASATIPATTAGMQYLLIVPDGNKAQAAATTVFAQQITVTVPDVKLATTITSAPSTASLGQSFPVSWTVTNQGTATTTNTDWEDTLYLSRTQTVDSSAQYVGSFYVTTYNGQLPLAPGAKYTATTQVNIPTYVGAGSYYLVIQADSPSYYAQPQSDASHSVAAVPITVTSGSSSTNNVDLVVTTAMAPAAATLGSSIPISFTVKNQGTTATSSSWTDAVYLSNTPTINSYSTFVTTFNNTSALAGGATYTVNKNITLPTQVSAGNHYLVFATNIYTYEGQTEINTTNNSFALPIDLSTPNLVPTSLKVTGATVEGNTVTVAWTVQNQGSVAAKGPWVDGIYLSDGPVLGASSTLLLDSFSEPGQSALAPLATYSDSRSVTLGATTTGNRYLILVTDLDSGVEDRNPIVNVMAVPITLTATNLAISNVSVTPTSVEGGNQAPLTLSYTVTNTSAIGASNSWRDAVYLSSAPVFNANTAIELTSTSNQSALATGASYTTTLTNIVMPNLAPGTYYVFFVTNIDYAVYHYSFAAQPESDASDNILPAAAPITVTAPAVNLQVSNPNVASSSLVDDQSVNVSFQVNNVGTETAAGTWYDAVYLSSSSTFDQNSATNLASYLSSTSPLSAGGHYLQSTNITIPSTLAPGPYYLFFVTNFQHSQTGSQGESNYNDNVSAAVPITVNAPTLALTVNTAPSAALLNDTDPVKWTVTNTSAQYPANASWTDGVFLSGKQTYDSSAFQLTTVFVNHFSAPLAAGGSYSETPNITFPADAPTGAQYLLFVTDVYNQQGQASRANDVVAVPITLSAPAVNLQVVAGSVTAPSPSNAGSSITVGWSVTNAGTANANGPWTDYVYLSTKNTYDSSAQFIGSASAPSASLPLGSNKTYQQTTSAFLPSNLTAGTYYLFVVANADNGQSETNTTDDVSAPVPITVTVLAPDLQVTSVSATPTTAVYGSSLSVTWTVKNTGQAAASGLWYDAVYVSANPTFDNTAQFLDSFAENQNLAAGTGQYTDTENVSLTGISNPPTGTAYILVVANAFNYLTESNTSNNTGTSSQLMLSAPDLVISGATAPATGVLGGTIPITWTVTNASSVPASAQWYDSIYISPDNFYDSRANFVASFAAPTNPLAAQARYNQSQTVTLPASATGPEYLLFITNQNNIQPETSTTNNIEVLPINVSAADLIVTAVNGPASASLGQSINVSWTIKNNGSGPADQAWYDGIYLSTKQTLDFTAIRLKDVPVGSNAPLVAGASYTQSASVTVPSGLATGTYYLLVNADDLNQQPETSESNNVLASMSFPVAGADLTVPAANVVPSSANFGQAVTVSWTVKNIGSGAAVQSWTDGIYMSAKSTFDNTATLLKEVPVGSNAPLASNASYQQSASVTVSLTDQSANGTVFLFVVANDQSQQAETNATNNVSAAQSLALTLPPLPDLVVPTSSIKGPANAFNNQAVLVSWTDQNNGTAAATGPWTDKVYFSTSSSGANPTLLGAFTLAGPLAAGASVQREQSVTLPATTGNLWIVVQTDTDQGANEGPNDQNDTSVAANPINVTQEPLPDLVVSSITPPSSGVVSGTSVPITYTVTNQGNAPTNAPTWYDYVFMSQDPTLTFTGYTSAFSDQQINNVVVLQEHVEPVAVANPSYLAPGDSYQQTVNVTLPINATGVWYAYVVTDGLGGHFAYHSQVAELNETNNLTVSSGFNVTLSPPPDLAVTSVQAPAQDFSGQPMSVSWTVQNNGAGATAATAWTDAVYMSSKATLDNTATLLGTFYHQGALAPVAKYTNTESVTLPVGVSGSFYFLVDTDVDGVVFENGATANNVSATTAAETVNLTPPPDLQVPPVSAPTTALASHALTFTYQVTNAGAGATPNTSWVDSYYLSPTATYNAGTAIGLGQQTHGGSLDAGAAYTNTVTATVPNGLSGSYFLLVNSDSGNAVFELNKTNNLGATASAIQIASKPADLAVTAVSTVGTAAAGAGLLVNWTVANQGTGDTAVSSWQDYVYADTSATLDNNAILLGKYAHDGLLNAGASYNQSQLVPLPITLAGAINLFVVTDEPGQGQNNAPVYETSTANDTSAAVPIVVSQFLADLQVTTVSGPATAVTSGSATVNWTVTNAGTGPTNGTYWYDDVWASTNTTLQSGGTDIYLGSLQRTNPLAAGGSYSAFLTVALPATMAAGTYYFIVATDRPIAPPGNNHNVNLIVESKENNNETAAVTITSVSAGALPDLSVSNVNVPATATSGTALAVSWKVTNNGAATPNAPINDAVYLSYDQVLDSADRYIGSVTTDGGLGAGASYTQNATLSLPAGLAGTFFVFVVTNGDHSILERNTTNNTAYDLQAVQLQLAPPADLVAGTVTIPANAVPGQNITLTYQVTNNGANAASGTWYDSLYLAPTPTWNVSDPILGKVLQQGTVAANGGTYQGTFTGPLPGIAPGSYYVIVRTNITDTIPEVTLSNNLSASLTQTLIDAPALTLGTAATGTLGEGQSAFYKVVVSAGQTLQITFNSQTATTSNELYVSYGTMPSRGQYDYRHSQPLAANQQITVPTTQGGTYYVLAYGASVPSTPENYSLTAALVPFAIQAIGPGQVGTGPSTIEIDGSKFDNGTTFQLLGPSGTVVNDQKVFLQDSSTAFVTFDLTGMPIGVYDVQATHKDGTTTKLAQALTVAAALPANVQISLSYAKVVLPGRQSTLTVNFVNKGNTDALAPLLSLTAVNALVQLNSQSAFTAGPLWFLATSANGPAGVLRPGESGQVTLPFQVTGSIGQQIVFDVQVAADSQPMDWASEKDGMRLPTISPAAWDGVFANFVVNVGSTVAAYHAALAADATYLAQLGEPTNDVIQLLEFEIEKANASYTAQSLDTVNDDSLPAPGFNLVFQRTYQQSIAGCYNQGLFGYGWTTNWDISALTDSEGNAVVRNDGATLYYVKLADGSYQSELGDHSVLTQANGAYHLVTTDGTTYQFNTNGTLQYVQDTHGNRITAGYNAAGQLVSLTDTNGASFALTYNSHGHVTQLTDSNGLAETYGYDATGQYLITYTDRYGTTTYTYVTGQTPAQNNALAEIAYADNTHLYFAYDAEGRLIDQKRDGGAEELKYTYGSAGGYTVTDANNDATTTLFNLFGATAETIDPLGNATVYKFDINQNLTEIDYPLGGRYTYTYDANGNIRSETDPIGSTTTFSYDTNNNLTSYTDAKGNTTSYAFNGNNDLLSITYANGTAQQFSYNPLGEATQYLNARGDAVSYVYNAEGLVTKETFADNSSYSYTYDNRGNLLSATDASGKVTTFTYADPRNPDFLTKVMYPDGTSLAFTYNVVGQRTQSVDQTGYTINYTYDAVGRLTKLTDGAGALIVQYTYDSAGNLSQKDLGNGTRTTYAYDADNNLLKLVNYAADHVTINSEYDYSYDALGRETSMTTGGVTTNYGYDGDGQLVSVTSTAGLSIQYTYDAVGNRLSQTVNGVTTTYVVNNVNEYTSATTAGVGTTTYHYDADGNLIMQAGPGGTTTYTFNDLNQLLGVSGPGLSASYFYDPLGNQISQTINGATTNFQIDPAAVHSIVAAYSGTGVYNNSGGLIAHYTYGFGLTSQVNGTGTPAYYDFDATGNVVGITDGTGTYVNRYSYLPFGETTMIKAGVQNSFKFEGQSGVTDDGSGTYHMDFRQYNPVTGQFLSNDPLGIGAGDVNVRRFVGNDPLDWIDPLGLCGFHKGTNNSFLPVTRTSKKFKIKGCANYPKGGYNGYEQIKGTYGTYVIPVQLDANGNITNESDESYPSPAPVEWLPGDPGNSQGGANSGGNGSASGGPCPCDCPPPEPPNPPTIPGPPPGGPDINPPVDPNAIIGPAGFGDQDFVTLSQVLPYTIDFENQPTAGLPAQQVVVTQQLDPNLNWAMFRLGSFGFAGMNFSVPGNTAFYQARLDLTKQDGIYVDVAATINVQTGVATWTFTTVDPATGDIPVDPSLGFLLPDNASGAGEGFVSYTIAARSADPTGTIINAQANVQFFTQPPLNTPAIFNTVDSGSGLTSGAVAPVTAATKFKVSWAGTDSSAGSAISSYTVYVSDNGGSFTPWLSNTPLTSATYSGQLGHTYGFYSVAMDNAGNPQPIPTAAQATTQVNITAPTATINTGTSPHTSTVSSLTITFNEPVTGLVLSDLKLTQGGSSNLLTAAQTLTTTDNITWTLGNLDSLTNPTHRVASFTLTLTAAGSGITDLAGNALQQNAVGTFTVADPLLTLQGTNLTVPGTAGNDTFTFTGGSGEQATLNGVTYAIDPTLVTSVQFAGNGGNDTATLTAAGAHNTAALMLGSGTLSGSGYSVSVSGVTTLYVSAASASDYAGFTASSSGSFYTGAPTFSKLVKGSQITEALGFAYAAASGTSGATAYLVQAAGQYLVATHDYSLLRTPSNPIAANEVLGFSTVIAYAAGHSDSAYLFSTTGSNHFIATPTAVDLITGGVVNVANGFQYVVATSSSGGDGATFADTPGSNAYVGTPGYSYLVNGQTKALQEAIGFAFVYAASGGSDVATLFDPTGRGGYSFLATPSYSLLSSGSTILNELVGFPSVTAQVTAGGTDYATLYDAPGIANVLGGGPGDTFLRGGAYYVNAVGFALVSAYATPGNQDTGYLSDDALGATLVGQGSSAILEGPPGYSVALYGFSSVIAYGSTGPNKLSLAAIDYLFSDVGAWMPV